MTTGAYYVTLGSIATTFIGLGVDLVSKPSFGTIFRSIMDLAVLGKIPGTNYYVDYYGIGYAVISFVVVYFSLHMFSKARKVINTTIKHPEPDHVAL